MNEYPDEIRQRPLPVIGLLGQTGLHPLILKNLSRVAVEGSSNKETKPCFQVIAWEFGHLFLPPRKPPKSGGYEGYNVQGILKANWLLKHTSLIPSVLALFFTHQPDDKNWKAKELEIITQLDAAKQACRGRTVKFLIVLVQSTNGDQYDERFAVLRKRAELNEKSFFIFNSEDLKNSVKRLEKVLSELSSAYYREEARRIKKVKDFANRKTQPQLFVRLNLKIAFFAEFRQDAKTSLKYYQKAYLGLRDVSREKKNIQEVKVLADYINFKICKIYITMGNALQETVTHFNAHIRTYKNAPRIPEREFEHWAWVARQYQVFGELLDMYAPNLALMSTGLLHPGYYYHAAASYAAERKKQAKRLLASAPPEKLARGAKAETLRGASLYVGQESTDESQEETNLKALYNESKFDHSMAIIQLLTKAYDKYKTGRLGRMILYLASEMAQEYFASEKYKMAKKFFDRIAITYRKEKWWSLLTHILRNAATTALKLRLPEEFVEYALELLQPYMHTTVPEKRTIQQNILTILTNPTELGTSGLDNPMTVDISSDSLISAKVRFPSATAHALQDIEFQVQLISHLPLPIRFSRLLIPFNNKQYDCEIVDEKEITNFQSSESGSQAPTELLLLPEVPSLYTFTLATKRREDLSCIGISLELGRGPSTVCFRWNFASDSSGEEDLEAILKPHVFNNRPTLRILEPQAFLTLSAQHSPPALVNEYYQFDISLENGEHPILNGFLLFEVVGTPGIEPGEETFFIGEDLTPIRELPLERIESNATKNFTVYVFAPAPCPSRSIVVKALYETAGYKTSVEKTFAVPVELPFDLKSSFYTGAFQAVAPQSGSIIANEPFLMCVEIQSISNYPLQISRAALELDPKIVCQSSSYATGSTPASLNHSDKFTVWFNLLSSLSGNEVDLGTFRLEWSRCEDSTRQRRNLLTTTTENLDKPRIVVTETLVPPLKIVRSPFSTTIDAPPHGVVGIPFTLTLSITNHTHRIEDFSLQVKENDSAFLFSGTKQSSFKVLPLSSYTIQYNLVPTTAGKVALPSYQLTSRRFSREISGNKQTRLIFIRPSQ